MEDKQRQGRAEKGKRRNGMLRKSLIEMNIESKKGLAQ
jgi:hypothetical protein